MNSFLLVGGCAPAFAHSSAMKPKSPPPFHAFISPGIQPYCTGESKGSIAPVQCYSNAASKVCRSSFSSSVFLIVCEEMLSKI